MSDPASLRVLVLDDDQFMLKLLRHQLRTLGVVHIEVFDSGFRALEYIRSRRYGVDLVLFDLNMPEMDGLEFLRHLAALGFEGGLVLISGANERILQSTETLVRAHGIRLRASLSKPVSAADLEPLLCAGDAPRAARLRPVNPEYGVAELRAAIASGELVAHYQPKVALGSGALLGVEALVRWQHPVTGLVFPDQFIGLAESTGLIDDLTEVVIRNALQQARQWRDAGLALGVAINVSMLSLDDLRFPDFVAALAAGAGIAPECVTLEVTESCLSLDLRHSIEVLTRLRLKGFGLSIDDFGTGHSSLSQLRDLPFSELKIAREFVTGATRNRTSQAICATTLALGKKLEMQVVAEGVEEASDWEHLHDGGCDAAQGYFIARPMPGVELHRWHADWNERLRAGIPMSGLSASALDAS